MTRSNRRRSIAALLAALLVPALAPAGELLLRHAHVYTAEPGRPYAEAVAVRDGRIVAVGSEGEATAAVGAGAEVVDLGGRTLLPGLIDSHIHAVFGGLTLIGADVHDELKDVHELEAVVAEARRSGRGMSGDVVEVSGIPLEIWSHTDELNAAFSGGAYERVPVYLRGMDGHTGWANAALRKRAGLDAAYLKRLSAEKRKYYGYDRAFAPNGFAVDAGLEVVRKVVPPPDAARTRAGAKAAVDYLHGLGITAWLDPLADEPALAAYRALAEAHELTAHVAAHILVHPNDPEPLKQALALREQYRGVENLTINGVKVFADGVVEYPSQTAAMYAPYAQTGKLGDLLFDPARYAQMCIDADRLGLVVHTHAIGDRAVAESLNGIEAARRANGDSGLPHTITHLQFVRPVDIPRFRALGVIASFQLLWASAGTDAIDLVQPYVDPAIYPWQYPARSLLEAGATIAGASDWFVSSPNVFLAIYQAETRRGAKGVLDAGQDMPREAMLRAYTINAARAMRQQDRIGSIAPGKEADFALVDRDVLTVPAEQLKDTRVVATMVGGRWVYGAP
ncbi:MAG: amidohydrolase [Proteobacteria bacterium]|nr:amidohydrolase [Pseudomonadota bacterium]